MVKRVNRAMLMLAMLITVSMMLPAMGISESTEPAEDTSGRMWTDGLGREMALPEELMRVSPSGNLAQMMLYALAPERMVSLARPLSDNAMAFILPEVRELPSFGNMFAGRSDFNKEAFIMAMPDALIDVGTFMPHMKEDFDELSRTTERPVVFVEGHLENIGGTIRELGKLLGLEERAEVLAEYADRTIGYAEEKREMIETPVRAYYSSSPDGLNGFPTGSFHGEILEFVGLENVIPESFSEGSNSVSLEQLLVWDPDVMFIQNRDAYETIMSDDRWSGLDAVRNGRVYLIPILPYPFLSNPPALNRLMGIWWLGTICYPELYSDIDMKEEMKAFYSLFYHYDLTEEEAESILSGRR